MPNSQVRERVRWLAAAIGPSIAANPNQLEAGLADLALPHSGDVRLIVAAARAGIARDIAAASAERRAELIAQASVWIISETQASPEAARWAVETWAMALEGLSLVPPLMSRGMRAGAPLAQNLATMDGGLSTPPTCDTSPAACESSQNASPITPWRVVEASPAPWSVCAITPAGAAGAPEAKIAGPITIVMEQPAAPPKSPLGPWNSPGYAGPPPCAWPRRDYSVTRAPWANTSGSCGPLPPEIAALRWNWGAFGLPFFWFAAHGLWPISIAWLAMGAGIGFLPGGMVARTLLVITVQVLCGLFGNKLAWMNRTFESVDHFYGVQQIWMIWGIAIAVLEMAAYALVLAGGLNSP